MTGKFNNAVLYLKATKSSKIHMQCQSKQCLMDNQRETKPNSLRQIRSTMQNKSRLTVSDQLYIWLKNGKLWRFHFLPCPSSHSHSHSNETSLSIQIPMRIPLDTWDPWEFRLNLYNAPDYKFQCCKVTNYK